MEECKGIYLKLVPNYDGVDRAVLCDKNGVVFDGQESVTIRQDGGADGCVIVSAHLSVAGWVKS